MQNHFSYIIEDNNDNVKLSLAHIRKILANIGEDKTLAIKDTSVLTKATIARNKINVSIRILRVLQKANIKQLTTDTRRFMIS